jgi:hypothetical protein
MNNHTSFFAGFTTVADIKKEYKRLAFIHHPDRGGDTATMQALNAAYDKALRNCHGEVSQDEKGQDHTYRYNEAVEQGIVDFIDRLIKSRILNSGAVRADLIGTWVWITGDTKPVKHLLGKEGLGCMWHGKRGCWYFQNDGYRHRFSSDSSLAGLAAKYGASHIYGEKEKSLV